MLDREFAVAVEAVRRACVLSRQVRAELVTDDTLTKKDRSPVTIADLGIQAIVSERLQAAFPGDPLMGEEEAAMLRDPANAELKARVIHHAARVEPGMTEARLMAAIDRGHHQGGPGGRFWTMDPIDGTKGFIRNDQYAVALALIEEGRVVLGVLGCPNLPVSGGTGTGMILAARRGQGAVLGALADESWRPARVAAERDPARAVICQSVESGHTSHGRAGRIAARLGNTQPSLHLDSQCKYAAVAAGDAGLYMRLPTRGAPYEELIWDHAAGWIIVEEAGGRVTDTAGRPLNFGLGRTLRDSVGVIATNGPIHDAVIAAVQSVLTEP